MKSSISIVGHADNRTGGAKADGGSPEPLVQILILEYGDIKSIAFHPSLAPTIAAALKDVGKMAMQGTGYESKFIITDDEL